MYQGPFRDDDPQWTPEWKEQVDLVHKDDGVFYIPPEDFNIAFEWYFVTMYQDWH